MVDLLLHLSSQLFEGGLERHDGEGEVTLAVFALDVGRAPVFLDLCQLVELHDLAGGGHDGELFDVGDAVAVFLFEAAYDVVFLAVFFQVAAGHSVDAVAYVGGHRCVVESVEGKFLLVEGYLQFCAIFIAAYLGVACAFHVVVDKFFEVVGVDVGLVEVVAVNLQVELVAGSAAHASARHLVCYDFGVLRQLLTYSLLHVVERAFALVFLGGADGDAYLVVGGRVEECGEACIVVRAGRGGVNQQVVAEGVLNVFFNVASRLECLFDACAALQLHGDADTSVVLLFHEVHTYHACGERYHRHCEKADGEKECWHLVAQTPAQKVCVAVFNRAEHAPEGLIEGELLLGLLGLVGFLFVFVDKEFLFFQHLAGEHRDECDGGCGRDAHHDGDDPAEFLEHDAGHAGKHRQRHEHSHDDQRRRDNRDPHLVGSADGSFTWILASFYVFGDVLQYHDSVVHHHSDSYRQRCHRHYVQRAVGDEQVDERGDQRDWYREADDDGASPFAEEHKHHEHHE